jgi:hypothetical protein
VSEYVNIATCNAFLHFHCRCPLYSDLEVIHDVAVQEEGIKAKKIVQAENPDVVLKHDPTEPTGMQQ